MRLFVAVAIVMLTGGAYLLVDAGVRIERCVDLGLFNHEFWTASFWLKLPGDAARGLGPNGRWFIRLAGGLASMSLGWVVLRIARR